MFTCHRSALAQALCTSAFLAHVVCSWPAAAEEPDGNNQQIALYNESSKQSESESNLNGTAQVTSHNGLFAVFSTTGALVPTDTNGVEDVYLRSLGDGFTILVSAKRGTPGNDHSYEPTISADGRYVAWSTWATNLTPDTNGNVVDVLVKDMYNGRITLVSRDSQERQRRQNSFFPVISGNGRFVSFQSYARLGPRDADRREDVYVRDTHKGVTRQASLQPHTSDDVRGSVLNGDLSDDGNLVTFGNDNSLWVRDMAARRTIRFHHEPDMPPCQPFAAGSAGRPAISGNGRYVAFSSCATALPGDSHESTDIFRLALDGRSVTRVTTGGNHSFLPSLSRSGRYVGFGSDADDLVSDDLGNPDAFVADLETGVITRASQNADGAGGNNWSASTSVAISGDGRTLAYVTYADNLVPDDVYNVAEAMLWRREGQAVQSGRSAPPVLHEFD